MLECQRKSWARHPRKARPGGSVWFIEKPWITRENYRFSAAGLAGFVGRRDRNRYSLTE
jgi:hypothetical protein